MTPSILIVALLGIIPVRVKSICTQTLLMLKNLGHVSCLGPPFFSLLHAFACGYQYCKVRQVTCKTDLITGCSVLVRGMDALHAMKLQRVCMYPPFDREQLIEALHGFVASNEAAEEVDAHSVFRLRGPDPIPAHVAGAVSILVAIKEETIRFAIDLFAVRSASEGNERGEVRFAESDVPWDVVDKKIARPLPVGD
ncbi:hypothetical protein BDK51DRAFT_44247 [Blyttiomyces helicus]|uniref:Uncharacterized protein n=1 Tax=Blyttiomyces helicus TaxID=388810 RepID=A0A4P9WPU0_9FUNG|nr:hypothetical protein BDK51DRAFT_44247 [Blyttiomyces helicus]|eukprot:RKO94153.1 hypothetical protein BDK51DRAFT_44247 [Blyttiomyces helicus]